MKKKFKKSSMTISGPLLDSLKVKFSEEIDFKTYPFSLALIKNLQEIKFTSQVTFFVGENGSGKSTILEAIANKAGFGVEGGSKNINFKTSQENTYSGIELFADQLTLSWNHKPRNMNGYFFRAETFFNVANYLDELTKNGGPEKVYAPYGGKSLHEQSHGESFLSFFSNRLGNGGFFIFDEPEAALSPQRQLSLLVIIHEMCKSNPHAQFIIATHSPLLLAYPNATIYSCDGERLKTISYTETDHYQVTKRFLDNPALYLKNLFSDEF